MNDLEGIINSSKHQIKNVDYLEFCHDSLKKNSVLILDDFLTNSCINEIKKEALSLENKAYYCIQNHTILLNKYDSNLNNNDPTNIEVVSNKGCVPHDQINPNSYLNKIYNSENFKLFLTNIIGVKKLYSYQDPLSSINYNYYQNNQQLGWHFDNASFAITLLVQSSDEGGIFEYVNSGRDYNNSYIDKEYISKVMNNKIDANKILADPGTLILFYGRNYLHRVTPVKSKKPRILVTLNYNEEEGIELSENARLTFFGRTE